MIEFELWKFLIFNLIKFMIGAIWHSQFLFGGVWMKEAGVKKEKIEETIAEGKMTNLFVYQFLVQNIQTLIQYYLIILLNSDDITYGIQVNLIMILGYIIPSGYSACLWENKSHTYFLISSGFQAFTSLLLTFFIYLF